MPQPRSSSISPLSQYVIRSGSGETSTPAISMSSAVLAITERPSPRASCIPAASFAPPVPPARTTHRPIPLTAISCLRPVVGVGEAGDLDAGVRLVPAVDADQQRRQRLHDLRLIQWARVDRPQSVDQLDDRRHPCLVGLAVTADQHVLVELLLAGQGWCAHGVEGRDDRDTVGSHLLGLLGRRALPDPERPGGLARDRGREWDRAVDEQLAFSQRLLQVREGLGLCAEGDGQEEDRAALGGLAVLEALDLGAGNGLTQPAGGLLGPLRLAGPDHDRLARPRQPPRKAVAERAGAAEDRDCFSHRRASYTSPGIGCLTL